MNKFEYQSVSPIVYEQASEVAYEIIEDASVHFNVQRNQIRYQHIINYLMHIFENVDVYGFSSDKVNKQKLDTFNNFLSYPLNLDMHCRHIQQQTSTFTKTVSGFTVFDSTGPLVFINADYQQAQGRIIFTIIHELVHVYKARQNPNYEKVVAMITNGVLHQEFYPIELRPIETETNIIASLLYASDEVLKQDVMNLSFYEMLRKYTISTSALHNRLINYFTYNCGLNCNQALTAVMAFRNNNIELLNKLRIHLAQ